MEVYGIAQILPVARVGEGDQSVKAGRCDVENVEASACLNINLFIFIRSQRLNVDAYFKI